VSGWRLIIIIIIIIIIKRQKITIDEDKVGAPRPKQSDGKEVAEGS